MGQAEYPITQRVIDSALQWADLIEEFGIIKTFHKNDSEWLPGFFHFMTTVGEYKVELKRLNPELKDNK